MNREACALTDAMSAVAAALHSVSGFHEPWDEPAFRALIAMPGAEGRLVIEDEMPVGLVLWRIAADEAEILTICTAPDRRRSGIGLYLLDTALTAISAVGARRLLLEVAVDNMAAIALYRARGFGEAGRRKSYYRGANGWVDALILSRDVHS
jgi:ribosomal-protein-alanine N-acetyltransferase